MKFTRIVYGLAAAYGFVSLLPLYFLIEKLGNDAPPAITHPEFYYGFVGLALLWQFVFVLIARTPIRYRLMAAKSLGALVDVSEGEQRKFHYLAVQQKEEREREELIKKTEDDGVMELYCVRSRA